MNVHDLDNQLERMWRSFHSSWVRASDELALLQESLKSAPEELPPPEWATLQVARMRCDAARVLLLDFERQLRNWRERSARLQAVRA